jgi:multidrug efflux pump subunit AcrA (membrane-fusion protein)
MLLLAGLLAAAYFVNALVRAEREEEGEAVRTPPRAKDRVVELGPQLAASHGVREEPARAITWTPRVAVYGRVVSNPRATLDIRAPFAGTLRAAPDTPWPAPGRSVRAGQVLGRVDIRVGPQERLDLQAKLNDARLNQQGAEDVLKIQRDRAGRLQKLSRSGGASQRELDEALVALAEARTQAAIAKARVELWQKALDAVNRQKDGPGVWSLPLIAAAGGEVTELAARPGTVVDAGALVARVVDFCRALVRLDVPPQVLEAGPPAEVELFTITAAASDLEDALDRTGATSAGPAVPAVLAGPAPGVNVASQFSGYWYEVGPAKRSGSDSVAKANGAAAGRTGWRPGLFVQAYVPVPAAQPRQAVSVPRTALLYHQGRAWVYVRTGPGRYTRRAVRALGRAGDRWVLAGGVDAGEPVVYRQAQVLLSEEFRGEVGDD